MGVPVGAPLRLDLTGKRGRTSSFPVPLAVAESGVDYISSGWITHSAPYLDLGLDVVVDV